MNCPNCGVVNTTEGSFCSNCGANLVGLPQTPTPSYVAPAIISAPKSTSNTYSTLAIIFGVLAVFFLPILFGPIGIVFGAVAKSKSEPNSSLGIGLAIGGMVLGLLSGLFFASLIFSDF